MSEVFFSIAKDFSPFTGGRFKKDGPCSGEELREDHLNKLLGEYEKITIEFSGTDGYGSSFLEEAFGGLVRQSRSKKSEILGRLNLVASDVKYKRYADRALTYIKNA